MSKSWRMMSLGLAFLGGCLFTVTYKFSPLATVQGLNVFTVRQMVPVAVPVPVTGNDVEQNPVTEPVSFPPLRQSLAKTKFRNWTENEEMKSLRRHGPADTIPEESVLNSYSASKLSDLYHSYLDNNNILCHRKLRMGKLGDGGWEVCDDLEWRPIQPCIVYSFGINYDFSFDDDLGKLYGCEVYSFDPSMARQKTNQRSDRVMFYSVGISGKSGDSIKDKRDWELHSLSNIRRMLNHTQKVIDILKMDVEGSEWPSLDNMMKERQLRNVRQLLLEFHQTTQNVNTLRSHLKVIGSLERLGFKKFYVHKNVHCPIIAQGFPVMRTACYEIHYVNDKFRRT